MGTMEKNRIKCIYLILALCLYLWDTLSNKIYNYEYTYHSFNKKSE